MLAMLLASLVGLDRFLGTRVLAAPFQKRQRPDIPTRSLRRFFQYFVLSVDPTRRVELVGSGRSAIRFHNRSLFAPSYLPSRTTIVAPKWLSISAEGLEREWR
jgi:hypothetical protein